jgi:hypothetical protein
MKTSSKFGTGGCYTCGDCCRKTRQTGRGDNENCGLCVECFERSSIENQMSDEGETPELLREWQGYIDACIAKGGKPSQTKWW